jgi:hypothetical protein
MSSRILIYNSRTIEAHVININSAIELVCCQIVNNNLHKTISIDKYISREVTKIKTHIASLKNNSKLDNFFHSKSVLSELITKLNQYNNCLSHIGLVSLSDDFKYFYESSMIEINNYIKKFFYEMGQAYS